ncbi:MAG TPA: hypothetical protein VGQ45_13110 [Gaiellales bacterium]|jgi:hypothetical protein|nr:hypothetical protein [Gaiellales bacterium]
MRTRDAYDAMVTLGGTAVPDYLSALGSTMYVGHHGISRQASGYQMGPTGGHPLALVRQEQRAQHARTLRSKLDTLVGQSEEIPDEIVISGTGNPQSGHANEQARCRQHGRCSLTKGFRTTPKPH